MAQEKGSNFSLFRPHTDYARRIRNIILSMLVIWATAVFGFQILLKVLEKPTPEKSKIVFSETWPVVLEGQATLGQKQDLAISLLQVAGKTTMKPDDKAYLDSALTLIIFDMAGDSLATIVNQQTALQKEALGRLAKADDKEYLEIQQTVKETRGNIGRLICPLLGIPMDGVEATLLPFHLLPDVEAISPLLESQVEKVMDKYTIHYQSVLTDTKFIGFPFHYFYTAVFLLVLFVALCYIYNIRVERLQKKFGIEE